MTAAPQPLPDRPYRLLPPPDRRPVTHAAHRAEFGPVPYRGGTHRLVPAVEESGLLGRGGAAYPTHRKLRAVADARGRPTVLANGAEGDPASGKDRLLLTAVPHLVLDGLQVAAEAVGARQGHVYVARVGEVVAALRAALAERAAAGVDRVPVDLVEGPARFLAGEETAAVSRVSGDAAKPRFTPPMVYERGVRGRPTLVQNVETLAHLALVARNGPAWFREAGTPGEPGTRLWTVSGAVSTPGVVELPVGATVRQALAAAGGATRGLRALLVGGYHGTWLPGETALDVRLSTEDLARVGGFAGTGVLVALPDSACGVVEAARVARYLADHSAKQCGPCFEGLPRIAGALTELATPGQHRTARADLDRWLGLVEGRGACHHPDGSVRFVRSTLRVFARELDRHARGRCEGGGRAVLPVPEPVSGPDGWR